MSQIVLGAGDPGVNKTNSSCPHWVYMTMHVGFVVIVSVLSPSNSFVKKKRYSAVWLNHIMFIDSSVDGQSGLFLLFGYYL